MFEGSLLARYFTAESSRRISSIIQHNGKFYDLVLGKFYTYVYEPAQDRGKFYEPAQG